MFFDGISGKISIIEKPNCGIITTKRLAQPSEIAAVVDFLLSTAAQQINLESICIDGGATLG